MSETNGLTALLGVEVLVPIDFSIYPDWYSDVILEAATQNCPEALIINNELERLNAENKRMRDAIEKALADSESGDGWGPDVTVCKYLQDSLGA